MYFFILILQSENKLNNVIVNEQLKGNTSNQLNLPKPQFTIDGITINQFENKEETNKNILSFDKVFNYLKSDNAFQFSYKRVPSHYSDFSDFIIPCGCIISPLIPLRTTPPELKRDPVLCSNCKGCVNLHTQINEKGQYICSFCGKVSKSAYSEELNNETIKNNELMSNYPEFSHHIIDYVAKRDFHLNSFDDEPNIKYTGSNNKTVIFLIDGNLSRNELNEIGESINKYLYLIDDDVNIGLIVYDHTVSIYEVGNEDFVSCETFSGKNAPNEHIKQLLADHQRTLTENNGDFLPPNYIAKKTIKTILQSLPGGVDLKNRKLYIIK